MARILVSDYLSTALTIAPFFLGVAAIAAGVVWYLNVRRRRRREALRYVASAFQGTVPGKDDPQPFEFAPDVREVMLFALGDVSAELDHYVVKRTSRNPLMWFLAALSFFFSSRRSGRKSSILDAYDDHTRLRFRWKPPGTMTVGPQGTLEVVSAALGTPDIQTGDSKFDRAFWINGSPEEWVRTCLDGPARASLRTLRSLGRWWPGASEVRLKVDESGVSLTVKTDRLGDKERLMAFAQSGAALFRRIKGAPAPAPAEAIPTPAPAPTPAVPASEAGLGALADEINVVAGVDVVIGAALAVWAWRLFPVVFSWPAGQSIKDAGPMAHLALLFVGLGTLFLIVLVVVWVGLGLSLVLWAVLIFKASSLAYTSGGTRTLERSGLLDRPHLCGRVHLRRSDGADRRRLMRRRPAPRAPRWSRTGP